MSTTNNPNNLEQQTTSHPIRRAFLLTSLLSIIAFGGYEIYSLYSEWQKEVKAQSVEGIASLKEVGQKGDTPLQQVANRDKEQSAQFQSQAHQPEKQQYVDTTKKEGLGKLSSPIAVTKPPSEEQGEQTGISIEPGQFIQDYYTAISNQQYEKTWLMLSNHFKDQFHCCHSDGSYKWDSYLKWWNSIQKVETLSVKVKVSNEDSNIVRAKLRYFFKKKGRVVDDAHTFKLVADTENGWLIDEQN
ncbi:hypothetical protein [Candidatus Parabeggiatoa sp. HSG14]|uniref:hypothetical protein n=1 Tax=Candidatus Parabeggiatoa sp. HSG14 TaxID=3055593 RepID=UPI0025A717A2|nr:hypothetical protein [Thiotrichales bacterium HSG14]